MHNLRAYLAVRLTLVPITLFFIFLINFLIITTMPGGPFRRFWRRLPLAIWAGAYGIVLSRLGRAMMQA